jgi:hypothetical protein
MTKSHTRNHIEIFKQYKMFLCLACDGVLLKCEKGADAPVYQYGSNKLTIDPPPPPLPQMVGQNV